MTATELDAQPIAPDTRTFTERLFIVTDDDGSSPRIRVNPDIVALQPKGSDGEEVLLSTNELRALGSLAHAAADFYDKVSEPESQLV